MSESKLSISFDGTKIKTMRSLYPRFAKALNFPAHFGKNLDALLDALCDLEGLPAQTKAVEITIEHGSDFLNKEKPDKRAAAIKVLTDACTEENRYDERQLVVKILP